MSLYIGLMSGTSTDGMDCALTRFEPELELIAHHSISYSKPEQQWLRKRASQTQISWEDITEIDNWIAEKSAQVIFELLEKANLNPSDITAIGSHGHTLHHKPSPQGYSWQLGNGHLIAELTGIDCINDFRRRDIAAQGQGAPLVSGFHNHILKPEQRPACIVNIGGIANLTYLSATHSAEIIGFDTGPGNCLMDEACQKRLKKSYDKNGEMAKSGTVQTQLLNHWLQNPYIQQSIPKSTGREYFNIEKMGDLNHITTCDLLATLTDYTAKSIALAIKQYAKDTNQIYVCGGGAKNNHLLNRLGYFTDTPTFTTLKLGIDPQWMEAMAFSWLAYRFNNNKTGNCKAVTGAKHERILGALHKA